MNECVESGAKTNCSLSFESYAGSKEASLHVEIYSDRSTSRGEENEGQLIENVTGPFSGVGQIGSYSKAEIKRLFSENLLITNLRHTETQNLTSGPIEVKLFGQLTRLLRNK